MMDCKRHQELCLLKESLQMKIWLLQTGEILPIRKGNRKLRTCLLAEEFQRRGYTVTWWASAFNHLDKTWLFKSNQDIPLGENITIKALKGFGYRKNMSLSRLWDHRLIAWNFKKIAPSLPVPDIIIASIPQHYLAYEAAVYAVNHNIPLVIDIRDPWPEIFVQRMPRAFQQLVRRLLWNDFRMTKNALTSATCITSMMKTLLDWGLTLAGRLKTDNDRVYYLGYKQERATGQFSEKLAYIVNKIAGKFIVLFIGTFAEYHNPTALVDCAKQFQDDESIHFILAGDGQYMSNIIDGSAGLTNLTLTGWIEQNDITELLRISHVGVCTTNRFAYFFPNKACAYLSEGLPVLSAFQGDLKTILEERSAGFYFSPGNSEELSQHIKRLSRDDILYRNFSRNARKVFEELLNADKVYSGYADHIENIYCTFTDIKTQKS